MAAEDKTAPTLNCDDISAFPEAITDLVLIKLQPAALSKQYEFSMTKQELEIKLTVILSITGSA